MKLGLKIFPDDLELIRLHNDRYHFYEVFAHPEYDQKILEDYTDSRLTIHAPHLRFGFDPAKKMEMNETLLNIAKRAADIADAKWIVVHPGIKHDESSESNMLDFFDDNYEKRIVFENLIFRDENTPKKYEYLFSFPEKMKELLKRYNADMLLDFGHAICSANHAKKDPYKLIKDFMNLKPLTFHISGIDINSTRDQHKCLCDSDNDFKFLKDVPKDAWAAFETDHTKFRDIPTMEKDIKIVRDIENARD